MKESNGDWWIDVGDEKARDKTSQALRENSLSVKRQIEEEFKETRRQQAREVAIAAGRDPVCMMSSVASAARETLTVYSYFAHSQDKAVEEVTAKPHLEPPPTGGKCATELKYETATSLSLTI
jgi:hypothetical protein